MAEGDPRIARYVSPGGGPEAGLQSHGYRETNRADATSGAAVTIPEVTDRIALAELQAIRAAVDQLEGYTDGLEALLTTLGTYTDGLEGSLTSLLAKDFATQATLAAVLAKLIAAPATEAKQDASQVTLAAILAKIIAAPATEAKQDALNAKDFATQTTLAAVLAKIIAAPATEAKQDTLIGHVDGVEGALNTIRDRIGFVVSTANTTTAALAGGATYTGTYEALALYAALTINVVGAPSTAQGTLYFEFSKDGVSTDVSVPTQVNDLGVVIPVPLRAVYPFFRARYVNGSTAQTAFKLTTLLHYAYPGALTRTLAQTISQHDPVEVSRAMVEPSPQGERGILGADRELFGAAVTGSRVARISADFSQALVNNRVTSTVTNGGTTAQANGQATVTTGADVNGTARIQSVSSASFQPGRESFCNFNARFTTPTSAASHQRIGLFDDNEGFFLGYQGTTFGFTSRTGAVDTFTALAAANGDPLNASFLSRFARGGVLEALNPLNLNAWRIRFAWASGAVVFEVQSPDGIWMRVHTLRTPNLQTTPSIRTPLLPMRMEAVKAAADATSLVMGSSSWAAGVVTDPYGLESYQVKSRELVVATAAVTGGAGATTTTLYTVNPGRRFVLTDIVLSAINSLATGGEITVADGNGGTIILRCQLVPSVGTARPQTLLDHNWKSPPTFITSVFISIPAIGVGVGASMNITGYEEAQAV